MDIGDVDVLSSALPTGASTSAKQDTIIGHVDGIEGLLTTIDADTGNLAGDIDTVMDTVDGAIDGNSDVLDTRAVLFAKKPNATYGNIEATAGGNLKVAVEEFDSALPAGTNAIGKLAANSGVDIGDVDILSIAAGDNNIGNVDIASIAAGNNNIGDVDVATLPVSFNAGVLDATTQRVTIATDDEVNNLLGTIDADTSSLAGTVLGSELQVDVVAALPAGTNAIGKLAANSGVDIGDVDVTSISAGDNNIGNVDIVTVPADPFGANADAASATGSISAKLRFIAATGIPITGTVTVGSHAVTNAGIFATQATLQAGSAAIGKLAANSGVDIGDVDVTSSALPTGASTLAEQQTQTTALQLIDNSIFVDDADWTADTSSHTLVGGVTQATPSANTDGDVTPLITNALRELRIAVPESDLATAATTHVKKYYTNAGAVTDGIIWSPAAGKRWFVTDLIINVSAAATVTLEDDLGAGDAAIMKFELAANSGIAHSFTTPWFSGEDAADLIVTTSAGNIYITVCGYEI